MKYLILIHNEAATIESIPADLMAEYTRVHEAVIAELMASGEFVETDELEVPTAKQVRTDESGAVTIVDGPYTEGREITGGYYQVDVATEQRALDIAARFVEARFAPVEVRRLVHNN
ncbi:YciI family protein [Frondihabitans australicus]|uniref:YCII-related domain-containing protein n=1 Tax=Frondihabitans australicus TaxID=386892 RepID=A0A495IN33_9MICO|nr:YciI family protein [Frondihabitans australicus]RKR76591.1 hypothetical protein C8E83_3768 [Frondihabitans australicus]